MKTKLTLSIEKSVIEEAKVLAKESGTSLSELTENFFVEYINRRQNQNYLQEVQAEYGQKLSSETVQKLKTIQGLAGIFHRPDQDQRDYKEILQEELIKRRSKLNKL